MGRSVWSSRRSAGWMVTAALAMAATVALSTPATANVAITRVSRDPYTNTDAYHQTELEPDTFAWGSTIVGVFQTGRFPGGGADNIGFATSTDGGATWTHGFLPSTTVYANPPGPYARISDPSIAYDAKHNVWMAEGLTVDTVNTVLVNRSLDGGLTWKKPVIVSTPTGGADYDKTWIACDNWSQSPHYGNCYAEVDDFNHGDLVKMFTSSDGGKTWSEATVAPAHGLGGQPLAQPSGGVVVPFTSDTGSIQVIVSGDGGATYSGPYTISNIAHHSVLFLRTPTLPSAEVDKKGKVYVVWSDCRFRSGCASNDIVVSTSKDGQTWTPVVRIPIDPVDSTVDHFIPGIGVDRSAGGSSARLALTYYYYPQSSCTLDTCQLDAGFVSSIDGGANWSTPTQILGPIKLAWLPSAGGKFVGDYISTSIVGDSAYPVIANAKQGNGNCVLGQIKSCNEYMIAPTSGLPIQGGTVRAGHDRVRSARSDHPWVRPATTF